MNIQKTEMRNPDSMNMDKMNTVEMARLVIAANYDAVRAVENVTEAIGKAADAISEAFEKGGRLFYIGAGTSGRLGVVDAAECPPTFGVDYGMVTGIIAGGNDRMFRAGENEEDNYENGIEVIKEHNITSRDVVVGISAAGNAAFVTGAIEAAKGLGCVTIGISSNESGSLLGIVDIPIYTDTGAEILTGSTRLKAGTAQKIVLNTLSTCAMTKTGKVYENMMINLSPFNEKLKKRVISITCEILSCTDNEAIKILEENEWNIRKAVTLVANQK